MIAAALLAVTVAFPRPGMTLPPVDATYMSGSVPRGVTNLVVQGKPVDVFRTGGWITMEALGRTAKDQYGRRVLKLDPRQLASAAAPKRDQILQTKRLRGPDPSLSMTMFRQMSAAHKTN